MKVHPVVRAILILPGTVLVGVPAVILLATSGAAFSWELSSPVRLQFWLSLILAVAGGRLMVGTVRLFMHDGEGTQSTAETTTGLLTGN